MSTARRCIVLLILSLALATPASAQIELTPLLGWSYGGSFRDAYYGNTSNPVTNLDVANRAHYGLAVGLATSMQTGLELLYLRQDTRLDYKSAFDVNTPSFDLAINYFHGGFRFIQPYGDWRPYFIFHLGATWFDPKERDLDSEWRFSWALGLGLIRPVSDTVGVRFQARWVGNYITSNSPTWCDPLTGFCYGYASSIVMWQGELTGGVTFALGS